MSLLRVSYFCCVCLWLSACSSLPDNSKVTPSYSISAQTPSALQLVVERLRAGHDDASGFALLANPTDAFVARLLLAQKAQHSIDAQYYLYHDDLSGALFTDALIKAAQRGVRVRLLLDDLDAVQRSGYFWQLDQLANIEVRVFNPFSRDVSHIPQLLTGLNTLSRRMHNKSFTVDNQLTILGGRNIGDTYFAAHEHRVFVDLDVLGIGPITQQVSASFDDYWNHSSSYPIALLQQPQEDLPALKTQVQAWLTSEGAKDYYRALTDSRLLEQLAQNSFSFAFGQGQVYADDPSKLTQQRDAKHLHMGASLAPLFTETQHDLIIINPYFVPGDALVDYLAQMVARGVRVRVLTNSLAANDVALVHSGYANYRRELLAAGIELYELDRQVQTKGHLLRGYSRSTSAASLHAKTFIADGQRVFIGSLNLDPRSLVENSEIGVLFDSPQLAQNMVNWFELVMPKQAFRVTLEQGKLRWYQQEKQQNFVNEPHTSWWTRFQVNLLGYLPIEGWL